MEYLEMYAKLDRHADRISRGDKDLKQDLLCLSYTTFTSAFSRRYELSLGELVNNMQLRVKEFRSEKRRHFGNRGVCRRMNPDRFRLIGKIYFS